MNAPKFLTNHAMFSNSDYSYLSGKGYTNQEIKGIWDRDTAVKMGTAHNNKPRKEIVMEDIIKEGICYVLPQTNVTHPIAYQRFDLLWYPERGMTLLDTCNYIPYIKSIVTENPWLICCYDRLNVRVWSVKYKPEGEWVCPDEQTYGRSINGIMMSVLGIPNTIAGIVLDGGKQNDEYREKLDNTYKNAR